jgi:hypothetical protein
MRKVSSADDTLSGDDSDFDLDDEDVGRLRLDESLAMTTSSLCDDSAAVGLDISDDGEVPGDVEAAANSADVPGNHVIAGDSEIQGIGDVSPASSTVPVVGSSPEACEVPSSGDIPAAVSSDTPGENDVIIDSNCWFVANCDDDYDEPLSVNVEPASLGGPKEPVIGAKPTVLPLYSGN